ncbi:hypothetical protein P8452_50309 [Trifolium repens]|nr:hypothetical protein P8452_50309 [Trifolium repens]
MSQHVWRRCHSARHFCYHLETFSRLLRPSSTLEPSTGGSSTVSLSFRDQDMKSKQAAQYTPISTCYKSSLFFEVFCGNIVLHILQHAERQSTIICRK